MIISIPLISAKIKSVKLLNHITKDIDFIIFMWSSLYLNFKGVAPLKFFTLRNVRTLIS